MKNDGFCEQSGNWAFSPQKIAQVSVGLIDQDETLKLFKKEISCHLHGCKSRWV